MGTLPSLVRGLDLGLDEGAKVASEARLDGGVLPLAKGQGLGAAPGPAEALHGTVKALFRLAERVIKDELLAGLDVLLGHDVVLVVEPAVGLARVVEVAARGALSGG